jgi:hypothetical protein
MNASYNERGSVVLRIEAVGYDDENPPAMVKVNVSPEVRTASVLQSALSTTITIGGIVLINEVKTAPQPADGVVRKNRAVVSVVKSSTTEAIMVQIVVPFGSTCAVISLPCAVLSRDQATKVIARTAMTDRQAKKRCLQLDVLLTDASALARVQAMGFILERRVTDEEYNEGYREAFHEPLTNAEYNAAYRQAFPPKAKAAKLKAEVAEAPKAEVAEVGSPS